MGREGDTDIWVWGWVCWRGIEGGDPVYLAVYFQYQLIFAMLCRGGGEGMNHRRDKCCGHRTHREP